MSSLISIRGLNRHFGSEPVLEGVDLDIPAGRVFGLVGENGSGKTTLIKHCLGLLRAQQGEVRVFDRNPVKEPAEVLGRIGFVSEDRDLPDWMTVREHLAFQAPFYAGWDEQLAEQMRTNFGLSETAKIPHLSRGQKAKLGLLVALAHRPELLLLDEPSSGLDPLARRDILEALIQTTISEGRTVFFSSHMLDEIERLCDWIGFLIRGRIVVQGAASDVLEQHRKLVVQFESTQPTFPSIDGATMIAGREREWTIVSLGSVREISRCLQKVGARIIHEQAATLEEIFLAYSRGDSARRP